MYTHLKRTIQSNFHFEGSMSPKGDVVSNVEAVTDAMVTFAEFEDTRDDLLEIIESYNEEDYRYHSLMCIIQNIYDDILYWEGNY